MPNRDRVTPEGFANLGEAVHTVREKLPFESGRFADPGETFDSLLAYDNVDALAVLVGVALALANNEVSEEDREDTEWVGQIALNHVRDTPR